MNQHNKSILGDAMLNLNLYISWPITAAKVHFMIVAMTVAGLAAWDCNYPENDGGSQAPGLGHCWCW